VRPLFCTQSCTGLVTDINYYVGLIIVSNILALLSMSCSILKMFAVKSRSRQQKTNKDIKFLAPIFFGKDDPTFVQHFVSAIFFVSFGKVWLSSVC